MSDQTLSQEDLETFRRDGAVCLRGVIDQPWRDLLAHGIARSMETPTIHAQTYARDDQGARYFMDTVHWGHIPEFMTYANDGPASALAAQALGASTMVFLEQDWFYQDAGSSGRTPWHHDLPYYDLEGTFATVWVPLDPAPDQVRLELIAGSHLWPDLYVPNSFDGKGAKADVGVVRGKHFKSMPAFDDERDRYHILGWDMEPGDCVLFHCRTIHSGAPSQTQGQFRRAATRFAVADDCRIARKGVSWSDFYENLPLNLDDGALVSSNPDYFPQVWPRTP